MGTQAHTDLEGQQALRLIAGRTRQPARQAVARHARPSADRHVRATAATGQEGRRRLVRAGRPAARTQRAGHTLAAVQGAEAN